MRSSLMPVMVMPLLAPLEISVIYAVSRLCPAVTLYRVLPSEDALNLVFQTLSHMIDGVNSSTTVPAVSDALVIRSVTLGLRSFGLAPPCSQLML